jgi:hypothetical protein
MTEILWAIVALILLGLLVLIALGLRAVPGNKSGLGVSNVFEDGLLFGLFFLLFAPFYLVWLGVRSIWWRFWPPPTLPVDGDDPVWGRRINRQVVETAFLAVQHARMKHNPNLAKRFISHELYQQLRRDCDHSQTNRDVSPERNVQIKEVVFSDERVEERLCYFNAKVSGTISSAAGNDGSEAGSEEFAEQLEFARALPSVQAARWQLMKISGR